MNNDQKYACICPLRRAMAAARLIFVWTNPKAKAKPSCFGNRAGITGPVTVSTNTPHISKGELIAYLGPLAAFFIDAVVPSRAVLESVLKILATRRET